MGIYKRGFFVVLLLSVFACEGMRIGWHHRDPRAEQKRQEDEEDSKFRFDEDRKRFEKFLQGTAASLYVKQMRQLPPGLGLVISVLDYGVSYAIPDYCWKKILKKFEAFARESYDHTFNKKQQEISKKIELLNLNLTKVKAEKENLRDQLREYKYEIKMSGSSVKPEKKKELEGIQEKLRVARENEKKIFEEYVKNRGELLGFSFNKN